MRRGVHPRIDERQPIGRMTMAEDNRNEAWAIPCPACGYDLRGQSDPRCPECGVSFPDFELMRAASAQAARVSTRVRLLRARVAVLLGLGFLISPVFAGLGYLIDKALHTRHDEAATGLGFAVAIIFFGLGGGKATLVFLQVLWCLVKPNVPRDQKRELMYSIPLLLIFQIPLLIAALMVVALIIMCTIA